MSTKSFSYEDLFFNVLGGVAVGGLVGMFWLSVREKKEMDTIWKALQTQEASIVEKIKRLETDENILFTKPALLMPSVHSTASLYALQREVQLLSSTKPKMFDEITYIHHWPYPAAVSDLVNAWHHAEIFAEQEGLDVLSTRERRKLKQLEKLINVAENATNELEEKTAYGQALKVSKSLRTINVPQQFIEKLEETQRKQIMMPATSTLDHQLPAWGSADDVDDELITEEHHETPVPPSKPFELNHEYSFLSIPRPLESERH